MRESPSDKRCKLNEFQNVTPLSPPTSTSTNEKLVACVAPFSKGMRGNLSDKDVQKLLVVEYDGEEHRPFAKMRCLQGDRR